MSTPFYNLFQNFVISVLTRNYIFILKRLSTNIDFIQCLLTNKQSLRTTVQLLQYKELRCATPNFKILQTFFCISLYSRLQYSTYYIQYLLIISIIDFLYRLLPLQLFSYSLYVFIPIHPLLLFNSYAAYIITIIFSLYSIYILKKQRHPNGWRCLIRICVPQSGVQGIIRPS